MYIYIYIYMYTFIVCEWVVGNESCRSWNLMPVHPETGLPVRIILRIGFSLCTYMFRALPVNGAVTVPRFIMDGCM